MKALRIVCSLLPLCLSSIAAAGEVFSAKEVESCFYADGTMTCSPGEFKITYYKDGDKIIRTNVFNFKKAQSIADDTVYKVIAELLSDPQNNDGTVRPQVTRAIGFPGLDAVEILSIGKNYIQAVKSTSAWFVISRLEIGKE